MTETIIMNVRKAGAARALARRPVSAWSLLRTGVFRGVALLLASLATGCLNDSRTEKTPTGDAVVTVVLRQPGVLAKTTEISLRMLYLTLSTPGADTLRDSIPLSGSDAQIVEHEFANLDTGKTWSLVARAEDDEDVTVHLDSTTFTVAAGQTESVQLNLSARFSLLIARFFPIRDSVTSVALFVQGSKVAEEAFTKQTRLGDTITLIWNYLPASAGGTKSEIRMDARGDHLGQTNVLLYRGVDSVSVVSGVDDSLAIDMEWAHVP